MLSGEHSVKQKLTTPVSQLESSFLEQLAIFVARQLSPNTNLKALQNGLLLVVRL